LEFHYHFIRDHDGDVVVTGRGRLNFVLSAFQAELIACMQGVQAAQNLGIGRLILETDALMIKQAMSSDEFDAMAECS
jgi:ribonuclease HI